MCLEMKRRRLVCRSNEIGTRRKNKNDGKKIMAAEYKQKAKEN